MPQHGLVSEVHRLRKVVIALWAGVAILLLSGGWFTDYRSCVRSQDVRKALRLDADLAREGATFWALRGEKEIAARSRHRAEAFDVPQLSCFRLLPEA